MCFSKYIFRLLNYHPSTRRIRYIHPHLITVFADFIGNIKSGCININNFQNFIILVREGLTIFSIFPQPALVVPGQMQCLIE